MKAAWQSVEDVCGILIYIPLFRSAAGSLPFSLTAWKNLTGAAINNLFHQEGAVCTVTTPHPPPPETLWVWISPSATICLFVGLLGVFFFELWAVCPTSRSDLWYHGAREGTRECEQLPCTEQHKPWGSRNVRGEAWQGFKNSLVTRGHTHTHAHTWLRGGRDSASQHIHTRTHCIIFLN